MGLHADVQAAKRRFLGLRMMLASIADRDCPGCALKKRLNRGCAALLPGYPVQHPFEELMGVLLSALPQVFVYACRPDCRRSSASSINGMSTRIHRQKKRHIPPMLSRMLVSSRLMLDMSPLSSQRPWKSSASSLRVQMRQNPPSFPTSPIVASSQSQLGSHRTSA